jgi:hypothetical protein
VFEVCLNSLLVVSIISLSFLSFNPLFTAPVHRAWRAFAIYICVSFQCCLPCSIPSLSISMPSHVKLFMYVFHDFFYL